MKFPLNTDYINKIKSSIRSTAIAFQTKKIPINQIGCSPGGRSSVEALSWPINEALQYFEKEGAIKITGNEFEIIKDDYFNISFGGLSLPITFSIDKRIEANLAIMTGLYALIYDLENRLRFFTADQLERKYGKDFFTVLPKTVRNKIISEKEKQKIYILDPRIKDLEFIDFSDFKKVFNTMDIISDTSKKQILLDKLDYLNEARTLIAHNNIIVTSEIDKIKDYTNAVKKIITP